MKAVLEPSKASSINGREYNWHVPTAVTEIKLMSIFNGHVIKFNLGLGAAHLGLQD